MPLTNSGTALFAGSGLEFVQMAPASELTAHLVRQFNARWGTVTPSEEQAWKRSLVALSRVVDAGVQLASGVAVELRLPLTDRRIDVSFVARDAHGRPQVFLVISEVFRSSRSQMRITTGKLAPVAPALHKLLRTVAHLRGSGRA